MPAIIKYFHADNFYLLCDQLAQQDKDLKSIIDAYGYPPMWTRPAGFATLVHIILEQQVSLASARAAFLKLTGKLGEITPARLLLLSDAEMKACYFSRQKMMYVRHLAQSIESNELDLQVLSSLSEDQIRMALKRVKGIGDWTVDIYLIFALQLTDIFPIGDLAMVNAFKEIKMLKPGIAKEDMLDASRKWSPHRSIATMLLWHYYLNRKGIRV